MTRPRSVGAAAFTIFFVSGVAAMLYEVVFAKALSLTFGSQATASTTVLTTYMGGLALGALAGGRVAGRTRRPARAYAACELGIGAICAAAPLFLAGIRTLYVWAAAGSEPGAARLAVLQVALGGLVLSAPTVLMGMTLPLLTRVLTPRARGIGSAVGLLYGSNTLGAALGAVAAGYLLLPGLGVSRTIWLAVALNALAALWALRLSASWTEAPTSPDPSEIVSLPAPKGAHRLGLLVLGLGGALTFALETTYIHLLAVVAGNSVYAFSLMLFCFLLGLGLGAVGGRRWLRSRSAVSGIAAAEIALALFLVLGTFAWDRLPDAFGWFGERSPAASFGARELFRFAASSLLLFPPALCIGAVYPMAMACVGGADPASDSGRVVGRAAALNTLGNVTGALAGGFLLLPALGSLHALVTLGLVALALALAACAALPPDRRRVPLIATLVVGLILCTAAPRRLDLERLASGNNVYFTRDGLGGRVIDAAESLDGGLTTVVASATRSGRGTHLTLRTNGKFQGSNEGEVPAQLAFALDPLLHTSGRTRALVIGFGTGTTARVLADAGFRDVDVAELSRDLLFLADRHFREVNQAVLERPNVHAHITDGRNFLLLSGDRYDLIGLEISSIWFAGAASLYNRELYQLARAHLVEGGVLQQWVQLHHVTLEDVARILASARAELPQVWLYFLGGQGVLVACERDCAPDTATVEKLRASPALASTLETVHGVERLRSSLLLDPAGTDRFLADFARATNVEPDELISTDDNLLLEYSTPRGNALPDSAIRDNLAVLEGYRSGQDHGR